MRPPRRFFALSAALASAAALMVALGSPAASARPAHAHEVGTGSQTFSDPVYYPLAGAYVRMDCVRSNPGCAAKTQHHDDSMTLQTMKTPQSKGGPGAYVHANVYAAGAGIVHIGADSRASGVCGRSATPFGVWVWIDHGGGVATRYGHLEYGSVKVHNGQYVRAGQLLAKTGSSGERTTCYVWYLNFRVYKDFHVARNGSLVGGLELPPSMHACYRGHAAILPRAVNSSWKSWNDVPKRMTRGAQFLHTTGCYPSTPAVTPPPTSAHGKSTGKGALTVSWPSTIAHARTAQVRLEEYHPSNHQWSYLSPRLLPMTGAHAVHSTRFTGLQSRKKFRAQFATHSSAGWSVWRTTGSITIR